MVLKDGDKIVLGENQLYMVIKTLSYEGIDYAYVSVATKNNKELLDKAFFVKEVVKDNKLYVSPVEDEQIILELSKQLDELVKAD